MKRDDNMTAEHKKVKTGDRIRQFLSDNGLKQRDIIEAADPIMKAYGIKLTKGDLSQYIHNKSEPQQNKLFILAKAMNVSESWLMGFDVPMQRLDIDKFQKIDISNALDGNADLVYKGIDIDKHYIEIFKRIISG